MLRIPYADSIHFFSEISPLSVLGSTLLDKIKEECIPMGFKHHYIVHALESEIVKNMNQIITNIEPTMEILKVIKPIYNFKAGE